MKFIFKLATQNLFRYKERTFLTCLSLAIGVCILIFFDGMLTWADENTVRNLRKYETASFKIGAKNFFKEENYIPIEEVIKREMKIEKILEEENLMYTPEIKFTASLINEVTGESSPFMGLGIEVKSHKSVYDLEETIYKGDFPRGNNEILISRNTSDLLDVKMGEYVIVEADTRGGAHNADAFKVSGIFDTPNPEVNRNFFYLNIDAANNLLSMKGDINLITVKTDRNEKELIDNLSKKMKMPGIEFKTWKDLAEDYIAISQGKRGGTSILLLMAFIIITVGIANTMNMAVFERTGEIGMMRAMGMTDREIIINFMVESGWLGLLGGILGIILGSIVNWYMIQYGWDFSRYMGEMSYGYRVAAVFRSKWNPDMMITALIFSIIASSIISVFPARRAIKRKIAETLKSAGKFG